MAAFAVEVPGMVDRIEGDLGRVADLEEVGQILDDFHEVVALGVGAHDKAVPVVGVQI